jgi:hypothetical protein
VIPLSGRYFAFDETLETYGVKLKIKTVQNETQRLSLFLKYVEEMNKEGVRKIFGSYEISLIRLQTTLTIADEMYLAIRKESKNI